MKYSWIIIGAGPAGILSIAKLLDLNIEPSEILWIDDKFQVGRIGQYYKNVPSNDIVQDWIDVLNNYNSIQKYTNILHKYRAKTSQPLGVIYHVFDNITQDFLKNIDYKRGYVKELKCYNNQWYVNLRNSNKKLIANKIILATGSHPIELNYQTNLYINKYIPLDIAIDEQKLSQYIEPDDIVAVVGSGQSAVLLLKYLTDLKINKIINFYKISLEESVNTLKALTKKWALKFLAKKYKENNIIRVLNTSSNRDKYLSQCTKIIYAVGYERNPLPKIRGTSLDLEVNDGIIGYNLFGIGIAFPAKEKDQNGHIIKKVGFTSFTRFLNEHIDSWLNY